MKVQNKVIVVTGGGNGIGQNLVLQLLKKGAKVAAADINLANLQATKEMAGDTQTNLTLHEVDISNKASVEQLAKDVLAQHSVVDCIINNAGIIHPFEPIHELDDAVIERVMNVNFYGTLYMVKAFLPALKERPEALIANVSSMGGLFAFPDQSVYGASKAAIKLLTEGLYAELRGTTVKVSAIYPGAIDTEITKNSNAHNENLDKLRAKFQATTPASAAQQIIKGIEAGRFCIYVGLDSRILGLLYRIMPKGTILLMRKTMDLLMT
ncbi:MAG: SDR family oxidoreductase [Pseudomonadales bacterium]|nr:SDR family oxidoreductase [Pseudomonadales bacterium]